MFQNQFLTGVVLVFERGEVLFKSEVAFKRIRYSTLFTYPIDADYDQSFYCLFEHCVLPPRLKSHRGRRRANVFPSFFSSVRSTTSSGQTVGSGSNATECFLEELSKPANCRLLYILFPLLDTTEASQSFSYFYSLFKAAPNLLSKS